MVTTGNFRISRTRRINRETYEVVVEARDISRWAEPGQFVNVVVSQSLSLDPFLARPLAIADAHDGTIRLVFRVRGRGTRLLAGAAEGDELAVTGPLGNGFPMDEVGDRDVVVLGAGTGAAGVLFAARAASESASSLEVRLGFDSADECVLVQEFAEAGPTLVFTRDGSTGVAGVPTDGLEVSSEDVVFACGPSEFLKAVEAVVLPRGVTRSYFAHETRMACGVGACMVCTCEKVDGTRIRVCKDGPVMRFGEVKP